MGLGYFMIRQKSFYIPDGNGIIQIPPPARFFTGVGTDSAADAGQDIVFSNHLKRFLEPADPGECHIGLGVDPQRTVRLTQRLFSFVDDGSSGKRMATVKSDRR